MIELNLQFNELSGEIPYEVLNISSLQVFSIVANNISGTLPITSEAQLPNVELLLVNHNRLSGKIPSYLSNLTKLVKIDMSRNLFTGPIPMNLGNLKQLQLLILGYNLLTGERESVELGFINSLTSCKYLELLSINSNPLRGILPKSIGNFSNLRQIYLFECQIKGSIPREIGFLENLSFLALSKNHITGVVPSTVGAMKSLQELHLFENNIEGNIPNNILPFNQPTDIVPWQQ